MLRLVHLGAPNTLDRLGEELGIPADAVREVLATDRYADAVRTDQAVRLGTTGVPLDQAWEQIHG
ncbi:hypothetical protein ABZ922_44050 [Streptomyces shenzhenensis]|uniref:hypothetical protein n=1 Tax=Streptomyces shenzhenensis TaxID=943815 RepID=UPI0033CB7487